MSVSDFQFLLLFQVFGAGAMTAFVAEANNRNPLGWFFLGFIFPIIALIAVGLAPEIEPLDDEEEPDEEANND